MPHPPKPLKSSASLADHISTRLAAGGDGELELRAREMATRALEYLGPEVDQRATAYVEKLLADRTRNPSARAGPLVVNYSTCLFPHESHLYWPAADIIRAQLASLGYKDASVELKDKRHAHRVISKYVQIELTIDLGEAVAPKPTATPFDEGG